MAFLQWTALTRFLDDGRIDLDTNPVERAIRPVALGRKNALFAGSDGGGDRWAIVASLIETAKLNGVEPFAWLRNALTRMVEGHYAHALTNCCHGRLHTRPRADLGQLAFGAGCVKFVSYSIDRISMNKSHYRRAARTAVKSVYAAARSRRACLAATLLAVSHLVTPSSAQAAQALTWTPFDLIKLQQTTLRSHAGAPYRIIVATPAGKAPASGYPVIYVVDGNAWTSLVSEIIRINVGLGIQSRVEPAVVVGIGYPTADAFDLGRRDIDFTSAAIPGRPDPDVHPGPNGGDIALMNFIDDMVKPVIQERFPIDRTRQTLLGHSLGGLFTLETLFARPRSFQTFVALSPSIWWNNRTPLRQARAFLARPGRPAKLRVFMSVGDLEQFRTPVYIAHDRYDDRKAFEADGMTDAKADADVAASNASMDRKKMVTNARQMALLLRNGHIPTTFVEFPDEDHFSSVPAALGRAVPFALGDQLPPW